ncbi:mitochondrial protein Pet127-domain-containing protein [Fusarium flagelliforme]|uniref:Uncharacterized protein n=1 Tax=Fusarium flagelliforme TaxID=2675880 RepID=A0A395MHM1_9HYPO|nr:mitochondrial protein Pet127-domain-containing protein [Fusarium flagelliforme]KAH7188757.1 mitochondrial protein Pet127-domain-containing protein [Fusarium flagelliforme]RFN46763.1 hypothetical protein FIE12Z_9009 [Fusarium flagelliforme]
MLRIRRGLGSSASFARTCRPHIRYPRQWTPLRSFATDPNLDDASLPEHASKASTKNAPEASSQESTHRRIAADDANFNEALDVVRRVYGVDKKQKNDEKQPDFQHQDETFNTAQEIPEETYTPETDPSTTPQPGVWTSLKEKLQQKSPVGLTNTSQFNPESAAGRRRIEALLKEAEFMKESHKDRLKFNVKTMIPQNMDLSPVEKKKARAVPKLAHNLEKVLFNPGPYQLQDRRTRVYNFDPYLGTIMPVKEFDFNALKEYVTSSKDETLAELTAKHKKKYCGSTSSMTAMLSHFHFLLSAWRRPNFAHLSNSFPIEYENFTVWTRAPVAAFARYKDGVYAIDADKEFDTASILSMLGKSMEKLLTLPKDHFEKYRRTRSHELSEEEKNADEPFHYTTLGDFMMRSQLDAYDPRLPGTGVFDLKTRAVVTIRMDVADYEKGVGYEIDSRFGEWSSFEREYYDMIRAAFLKYSLQVRMGRMDGIFVAFHNTERIFGFQYISLEEMDHAIHGTANRKVGDGEFKASIGLLNDLLDRASERFPKQSLRIHVETRPLDPAVMYFVAEPVSDEEMQRTQDKGKAAVEKLEKEILGITRQKSEDQDANPMEEVSPIGEQEDTTNSTRRSTPVAEPQRQKSWDEMMAKVDQTVENDAAGMANVRIAIEQAIRHSGLLATKSKEERQAYLDELVEALGEDLRGGKEGAKGSNDALNISADEPSEVSQGSSSATGLESENVESDEAASDHAQSSEIVVDDTAKDSASLKDLILKVAEGVEGNTSNLGTFERVLSELVREQKQLSNETEEDNLADTDSIPITITDDSSLTETATPGQNKTTQSKRGVLGMYVTVRNKVDDKVVKRVENQYLGEVPNWTLEYAITELSTDKARKILTQIKARRRELMNDKSDKRSKQWYRLWNGQLMKRTNAGRKSRKMLTEREERTGIKVAWKTGKAPSKEAASSKKKPAVHKKKKTAAHKKKTASKKSKQPKQP